MTCIPISGGKKKQKGGERKGLNLSNKPDNGSYTPVGLK